MSKTKRNPVPYYGKPVPDDPRDYLNPTDEIIDLIDGDYDDDESDIPPLGEYDDSFYEKYA